MVLAHFMGWRMKRIAALGVCVFLLGTLPAAAQSYPGEEVTVNPGAFGSGYLLYPGGKYGRHVGHLLQPGERRGPIRLHMPVKHARPAAQAANRCRAASDEITIPAESAPLPPRTSRARRRRPVPRRRRLPTPTFRACRKTVPRAWSAATSRRRRPKPVTPPPQRPAPAPPGAAAIPFTFGGPPAPAAPPPHRSASATPHAGAHRAAAGRRSETGQHNSVRGRRQQSRLNRRQRHPFAGDVAECALNAGAQKVQLEAYGGPRGDKSSDSRRLSLKRALVVRELLIEDGVPSETIDVRAMGGADDTGAADRVDVFPAQLAYGLSRRHVDFARLGPEVDQHRDQERGYARHQRERLRETSSDNRRSAYPGRARCRQRRELPN